MSFQPFSFHKNADAYSMWDNDLDEPLIAEDYQRAGLEEDPSPLGAIVFWSMAMVVIGCMVVAIVS